MTYAGAKRLDDVRLPLFGAVAVAGAFVVWASRAIGAKGLTGLLEICAAIVTPFAAWIAWMRPIIFPYGVYAIIAPLDVLTQMGQEGTVARLAGVASAVALFVYAFRTRAARTPPLATVWILLFAAWMALSTLWSMDSEAGKEAMTMVQLVGLYLAVACYPMRRGDLAPLLGAILLGGVVAGIMGIYDFRSQGVEQTQYLQTYNRINLTIGTQSLDPNLYSDGLLLPIGIALAWLARTRRYLPAVLALVAIGIMVWAMALAASREAFIGLGIVVLLLTVQLRAFTRILPALMVLLGGALAFFPNVISRAFADAGNGGSGRTSIWDVGVAAFLQHPLVGTGAGSFASVYDRWYLRIFQTYDDGWHRASHDIVVHYGVELGLIGLLLLAGWCASQWLLARSLPRTGTIGTVRAVCIASLVALAFVSFFVDLFDAKFVWLLFGLVVQAKNLARVERGALP